jgi:hypothetical protein
MRRGLRAGSKCVLGRVACAMRTLVGRDVYRRSIDRKRGGTYGERITNKQLICVADCCHPLCRPSGLAGT